MFGFGDTALPVNVFRPSPEAVTRLLTEAGLPTDDLPDGLEHFLACGDPDSPDGVVGLEIFGRDALLRSLVVREDARGSGIGLNLVAAAESRAADHRVSRVYLLTETAEAFFAALGYTMADRPTAPAAVRASRQFSELCPASAAFMIKMLRPLSGAAT